MLTHKSLKKYPLPANLIEFWRLLVKPVLVPLKYHLKKDISCHKEKKFFLYSGRATNNSNVYHEKVGNNLKAITCTKISSKLFNFDRVLHMLLPQCFLNNTFFKLHGKIFKFLQGYKITIFPEKQVWIAFGRKERKTFKSN